MTKPLDAAYEFLRDKGPEYGPLGLSNHGPMAAEALAAVGREDAILPWLERYGQMLGPQPDAHAPISPEDWQAPLGQLERYRDWLTLFERELAEPDWQSTLDRWVARLAPGLSGAARHGLLRAAHATRALGVSDTSLRRFELAQGLAYWAACFYRLPGTFSEHGGTQAQQAIDKVPLLPIEQRPEFGLITVSLERLVAFAPFASVAGMLDLERPPEDSISDLTETFANAYLANATPVSLIALIHMLTGPSSVRLILPHVSPTTARQLVGYAWQAGAALFSAFAITTAKPALPERAPDRDELIDRAIAVADEHAIKFTEACLREEAVRDTPIFRTAADDVIRRMAVWSPPN